MRKEGILVLGEAELCDVDVMLPGRYSQLTRCAGVSRVIRPAGWP